MSHTRQRGQRPDAVVINEPLALKPLRKHFAKKGKEQAAEEVLRALQQELWMIDRSTKCWLTYEALTVVCQHNPHAYFFFLRWIETEGEESLAEMARCMGVNRSTVTRAWAKGVELFIGAFLIVLKDHLNQNGNELEWRRIEVLFKSNQSLN